MDHSPNDAGGRKQEFYDPVDRVQAYQLALEAMRLGREDARALRADVLTQEVGGQLLRATASSAANIAEG